MNTYHNKIITDDEKDLFSDIMSDYDRLGLTIEQIEAKFNCSRTLIYARLRDPEIEELIKKKRSSRIKIELAKVDNAVLRKAAAGDIKACELIYKRWDHFVDKLDVGNYGSETEVEKLERKGRLKDFLDSLKANKLDKSDNLNSKSEVIENPITSLKNNP